MSCSHLAKEPTPYSDSTNRRSPLTDLGKGETLCCSGRVGRNGAPRGGGSDILAVPISLLISAKGVVRSRWNALNAVKIAADTAPTISPYWIAVAPLSDCRNFFNRRIIFVADLGQNAGGKNRWRISRPHSEGHRHQAAGVKKPCASDCAPGISLNRRRHLPRASSRQNPVRIRPRRSGQC